MADRSSERDRRVRQLVGNRNPGFDVVGQAQAEIQDAQSELYNHVALQQAADQSRLQETSTISQAAQGLMEMGKGDQLQVQAASMNPSTQATLGRFGVKPSQSHSSSRNAQSQRVVTKSGDTTNIKNENVTNNHTDIKITQPSIPMQAPVIPMRGGGGGKDNSGDKFKTWLSGMFARQQNEAEIQRKEYRKKEWALGRTTSKLMKKIGEATSNLGSRLDPKNMTTTLGGQLKWLLLLFGATMIGKVWKPAMKLLANMEGGFRAVFGLPINDDLKNTASSGINIIENIKNAIGIDNKDKSLIGGIRDIVVTGINKLIAKIDFWFEDRAKALKTVEFPDLGGAVKFNIPVIGDALTSAMSGVIDAFKGVGQYLGDIITVAMGGTKGKVKVAANKVAKQAQESFTNTQGKKVSVGDSELLNGGAGRDYMRDSDYNTFGGLKNEASSTQAMSRSIISMINDTSGKSHAAEIATGVSQLFDNAKTYGEVTIDPELLSYLGITPGSIDNLKRTGKLTQKPYKIIFVKPNQAQLKEEVNNYDYNLGEKAAILAGKMFGSYADNFGGIPSKIFGFGRKGAADFIKKKIAAGLYPKLVPASSNETSADGTKGVSKQMWVLSKEGADQVIAEFTRNTDIKSMDMTDQNFFKKIEKIESQQAHRNRVTKNQGSNISLNNMRTEWANQAAYDSEYDRRITNNPEFAPWNNFSEKMGGYFESGVNFMAGGLSNVLESAGNIFKTVRGSNKGRYGYGHPVMKERIKYLMGQFIGAGMKPSAAAGIVGNLMCENLTAANLAEPYPDGKKGEYSLGIAAFHSGGQLPILKKWCQENGYDWRTLEGQTAFLVSRPVFRKIAQVTSGMDDNKALTYSAQTWGYDFEKFVGYKDLGSDNYKNRIKMGGSAYSLVSGLNAGELSSVVPVSDPSSVNFGGGGNYTGRPSSGGSDSSGFSIPTVGAPLIDLSKLKSTGNDSEGGYAVGWLGDSQTALNNGLWPKLVGQGLKCSFVYFGRTSARADHYLGANERGLGTTATNSGKTTCKSMLDLLLSKPPKYVLIALGHNGMTGYASLVSTLKSAGSLVIGIKMWPINGAGSGMSTFSSEQMKKMYSGISADGWVDLTTTDIPKASDGVHATSEGCKIAAAEVLRQLFGGGSMRDAGNGNSLLGSISDKIGDGLLWLADKINPESESTELGLALNPNLSEKQKQIIEGYQNYSANSDIVNQESFEKTGFVTDNTGTYLDMGGGYEYHVDPTQSTALVGGATGYEAGSFVSRRDENGVLQDVSKEEEELIRKSVSVSMSSFFSEYEGKGKLGDVMVNDKGETMKFPLGSFSDIEGFSRSAQASLKEIRGGKITYWVYPTKDRSTYSIVEILPFASMLIEAVRVGPIIYKLGSQNPKLGTLPQENIRTDWQPIADYLRVKFTPKSIVKLKKLFILLSYGKLSKNEKGEIVGEDGTVLTKEDLKYAVDFGMTNSPHELNEGYNKAQEESALVLKDRKFDASGYLKKYGATEAERKEYIKTHKGEFAFVEGKIYGRGGVEIGSYDPKGDKSNFTLLSEKEVKSRAESAGNKGLSENNRKVLDYMSREAAAEMGFVDRNAIADLMAKSTEGEMTEAERQKLASSSRGLRGYLKTTKISGEELKYKAWTNDFGDIEYYTVDPKHFRKLVAGINGLKEEDVELDPSVSVQLGKAAKITSEKELLNKVAKLLARVTIATQKKKGLFGWGGERSEEEIKLEVQKYEEKYKTDIEKNYKKGAKANETDKLRAELIREGKKLSKEVEYKRYLDGGLDRDCYQIITYEDDSTTRKYFKIDPDNGVPMMKDVNAAIDRQRLALEKKRFKENYEGSTLQESYKSIVDKINSGELTNVTWNDDGTVTTAGGATFKYTVGEGGKRTVKAPTAEEAHKTIKEFYANRENKIGFYQRRFGAVMENGKLYVYDKNRISRVQINLDSPISGDLRKVMVSGSLQARESNKSDSWDIVSEKGNVEYDSEKALYKNTWLGGTSNSEAQNQMLAAIASNANISAGMDINNDLMKNMLNELGVQTEQGITAEGKRNLQIKHERETSASTKQTAALLQTWADNGFKTQSDLGPEVKNLIDQIKKDANAERKSAIEDALKQGSTQLKGKNVVKFMGKDKIPYYLYKDGKRTYEITGFNENDGTFKIADRGDKIEGDLRTVNNIKIGNETLDNSSVTIHVTSPSSPGDTPVYGQKP